MRTLLSYISILSLCLFTSACTKDIEEPELSRPYDPGIVYGDFEITLQDLTDTHVSINWESCGTDAKYDLFINGKRITSTLSDQGYEHMYYELNTLSPNTTYHLTIRSIQSNYAVKHAQAEFTTKKAALISLQFFGLDPYEYKEYEWTNIRPTVDGGLLGIATTHKQYDSNFRTIVKLDKNGNTEWLHDYAHPRGDTYPILPSATHFNDDGTLLLVNWDFVLHLNSRGELLQYYPFYGSVSDVIILTDARITPQGKLLAIGSSNRNAQNGEEPYSQYYTATVSADGTQKEEHYSGDSLYNELLKMEAINENTYLAIGSTRSKMTCLHLNAEGVIEREETHDIGDTKSSFYFSLQGDNGEVYFAGEQNYWPGGYQNTQSFLIKFSPEGIKEWEQFYPQSIGFSPSLKSIRKLEGGGFILTTTDYRGSNIILTDAAGIMKWGIGITDSAGFGHIIYADIDVTLQQLSFIDSYGQVAKIDLNGHIKEPFIILE